MHIDLSTAPATCEHCILGKQAKNPVPTVREGKKASRILETVYIDLMGPQDVTSSMGNHFVMDIIDDHSDQAWAIPLANKSNAFPKLQAWELTMELKMSLKVGTYWMDNGELKSNEVEAWLAT